MSDTPRGPATPQLSPRLQWLLLGGILLAVALIRTRLLDVPLERDEGDYAYGAQQLLAGRLPYRDFFTLRMPGIYVAYAFALALFGNTAAAVHLALLFVHAATMTLVFLTGRALVSPVAGLLAAAFYGALCLGGFTLGLFANSEHYVVLFAMAGIALLACAGERAAGRRLLLAGVLLGSAVLVKHHGALFVAFGAILALAARPAADTHPLPRAASRLALYAAGVAIPFVTLVLVVAFLGLWQPFWFWTVEYASVYASSVPVEQGLGRLRGFAPRILFAAPVIWGLAAAGIVSIPMQRATRPRAWRIVGLAAFSAAAVSMGLYFRAHYFILLFPAVALLAGAAAESLAKAVFGASRAPLAAGLIGAAAVAYVLVYEGQPLFRATPAQLSADRYGPNPFPESLEIGRYLAENSAPGDRLLVLGSEPQIYFYAGRSSVTPHIHMYPLMEAHRFADEMQQQLIRDADAGRPEFIVVVHVSSSWLSHSGSSQRITEWMVDTLPRLYQKVGLIEIDRENGSRFYWDDDARARRSSDGYLVQVFRRRAGAG